MKEVIRLRQLEAECRMKTVVEPEKKRAWLAQAAKYQFQADMEIAFHFEECNTTESIAPEIKLRRYANAREDYRGRV
jgi:hypothetical protein